MRLKTVVAMIMAAGFALPMVASAAGDAAKAEEKFSALDTNQDGVVDRDEAAADPDVAAAFEEINVAGTGEITLEEFSAWEEVSEPGGMAPGEGAAPGAPADPGMAPDAPADAPTSPQN